MSEKSSQGGRLAGLRVAAFESRMSSEFARMISKEGGQPFVSPSMREVPLENNRGAVEVALQLLTGAIDVVVFMTGVGTRQFVEVVSKHVDQTRLLNSLKDITTVARGPKPAAALKELGIDPTIRVAEPNTWREVVTALDQQGTLLNKVICVQEYGLPNASLVAGLEARGARVIPLRVYRWELPEDTGPLEANVLAISKGERDIVVFTSAQQLANVLTMVERLCLTEEFRQSITQCMIASIGPTTSEALASEGMAVDLEPAHSKLGHLVQELAEKAQGILANKRKPWTGAATSIREPAVSPMSVRAAGELPAWYDSPFMRACRREPVPHVPVWLMRQAGRYMAEYRAIRAKVSFAELCRNAALCAEVMVTAVDQLGVDAAIVFSDLLPILEPLGLQLEFSAGDGPVIHNPIRTAQDVNRVAELEDLSPLQFVMEAVAETRRALSPKLPLIGFAGAPFTLASYAIEGGGSKHFLHTKMLMHNDPPAWHALMDRLARAIAKYLQGQIAAGAQALQLFDSWVGCLSPADYKEFVLPATRQLLSQLPAHVPVIHFFTGNPALVPLVAEAGGQVIGLDWRCDLAQSWRQIGHDRAVQGNLDPNILLADPKYIRDQVAKLIAQSEGRRGFIFNLGHGVLPQTPVAHAVEVVKAVHELTHTGEKFA